MIFFSLFFVGVTGRGLLLPLPAIPKFTAIPETGVDNRRPNQGSFCALGLSAMAAVEKHKDVHIEDKPDLEQDQKIHAGKSPPTENILANVSYGQTISDDTSTYTQKTELSSGCSKSFSQLKNVRGHLRTHTSDKPYLCGQCGKCFSRYRNLTTHILTHTGEKPYSCSVCSKLFSQLANLRTHLRIHTRDKSYHCAVCGKTFSNSGNLKKHQYTHTGEKPYHCADCGKFFSHPKTLACHKRTHTGEKPYQCELCGRRFAQSGTATRHQQRCRKSSLEGNTLLNPA